MYPTNKQYPNLRILTLTDEADVKRLLLLLSGECFQDGLIKLENDSYLDRQKPKLRLPASLIADLILPRNIRSLGVQSVIIESDYVDRDSNVAYAWLYARAFRDYPRRTVRLHFFRKQLTSYDELLNEEDLQKFYVGYCVLSPILPGNIWRTVLPPPKSDSSRFFVPAQSKFSVNLSGAQLCAMGTAFIQQDGRVAACTNAAAWMSTIILAKQSGFDMSIHSLGEITQLATKYSLPPFGSGAQPGLTVQQFLWALHEMSYEPLYHEIWDPEVATEIIYNYVESGIPPILIIFLPGPGGFHAVTAVGHTYDPFANTTMQINRGIRSASAWCPFFLIHDDQIGPYIELRIGPVKPQSKGKPSIEVDITDSLLSQSREKITK